jgi:general secretion pathway protein G
MTYMRRFLKNKVAEMKHASQAGFSLVEILIVIALIAMIGTFVTGQIISKYDKAKWDGTKVQMRQLGTLLDQYKLDCGQYPTEDQGLESLLTKPETDPQCQNYSPDGYVKGKKLPKDGFGEDFQYKSDGVKYEIISFGRDKKEGGEGIDADLNSSALD